MSLKLQLILTYVLLFASTFVIFSLLFRELCLTPLIKQLILLLLNNNWKRGILRGYILGIIYKNKEFPCLKNQNYHLEYWILNNFLPRKQKFTLPKAKVRVSLMCGILNAHNKWFMLTIILTSVWMYVCLWACVLFL